jgi:tricorn protease
MKVYELALTPGQRSPFAPIDELHPEEAAKPETKPEGTKSDQTTETKPEQAVKKPASVTVSIDFADLASRLSEVPVPPGNYSDLEATQKRLCWLDRGEGVAPKQNLACVDIANKGDAPETVLADVKGYEISLNRKKMLVAKGDDFYILDSDVKASALADAKALPKAKMDLSRWTFDTDPRAEFRELFEDAWRLERDYFYDRHMHGVDWNAMRDRYLPLVDRVADRDDLNDVIAQMVSELSALHTFVRGGDSRGPADDVGLAALGCSMVRDEQAGGYVVRHIYRHDPDLPNQAPPLARPDSMVHEGEVTLSIDGEDLLSVSDERALLRGKAGRQVLLRVKSPSGQIREVITTPISDRDDRNLRYNEWEYSRRLKVDSDSQGQIGYVHLRAMGSGDIEQCARDFYPVFDRQGLIIDVRHNGGGNIDSWLLAKLLRQAWFWWQPRVGNPSSNMQYAFRGHMVVLCDQLTGSDGEAFTEGFRRLGLGKVIGTRTWGGEIWLSASNVLADRGIATAGEMGVYGPEGKWLIEGHGVDPDIVVDNLPHATFGGRDAQLDAAMKYLKDLIRQDPRPVPKPPPYPNKAFKYGK